MWSWPVAFSALLAVSLQSEYSKSIKTVTATISRKHWWREMTHRRWSLAGGGSQWSKFVSTRYHLEQERTGFMFGFRTALSHLKPALWWNTCFSGLRFGPTLHSQDPVPRYQQRLLGLWWWRRLPPLASQPRCNTPRWWWASWRDASLHPESPSLPPVSAKCKEEGTFKSVVYMSLICCWDRSSQQDSSALALLACEHQIYKSVEWICIQCKSVLQSKMVVDTLICDIFPII